MKNYSKFLLAGFFCTVAFGAGACSNADVGGTASTDEEKKVALVWDDARLFDAKSELPDCKKFDGVAQVIDEKSFFKCVDGKWELLDVSAPAYEQLPKCDAPMNDFCIDIVNDNKVDASYVCDEGKWVKGTRIEGFEGCFKGDENGGLEDYIALSIKCSINPSLQDCINGKCSVDWDVGMNLAKGTIIPLELLELGGQLVFKQFFSLFIDDGCCSISSYMDKPYYSDVCE